MRHRVKKGIYWLILALVACGLVGIASLICGLLFNRITPESGRTAVQFAVSGLDLKQFLQIQPHPYLIYANTPGYRNDQGIVQHNSLGYRESSGYRAREISLEPSPGTLRILALGGSVTYGYGVEDPRQAWPAQLEGILSNKGIGKVEVINGGINSASSAEILMHYLFRDRYLGANIVIINAGDNDDLPLMLDHYNPEYTHYMIGWKPLTFTPRRFELSLLKLNIFKVLYAWWLNGDYTYNKIFQVASLNEISPERALQNARQNNPIGFRRNLDLLVRNIIQDGATPIFFNSALAPQAIFENPPPNLIKEEKDYYEATKVAFEKNSQVIEAISQKYGVPRIQLSAQEIPLSYFIDNIHLNADGEKLTAQVVSDKIKPIILKASKKNIPETAVQ